MTDYRDGIKKDVAEIKFLIHDLRVERFINEVIHFHVTLNTDLEIFSIEQAQILHGHDLQVLKENAVALRKAYREYSAAVKNFSPDRTILRAGRKYIDTIRDTCSLILNPLWGRADNVLTFLPPDSHSARSHDYYRNCIRWIRGVAQRIESFLDERENKGLYEEFDIAAEVDEFTHDVIEGYVAEQSGATVELRLGRLDAALIGGNRYRFRRMYFNLVMNAVDAMAGRKPGFLEVTDTVEGDRVVLRVRDNGEGMSPEKIKQLMTDRETLDGELHSLGFVFVRQTIAELKGELSIQSDIGSGTTVTISFPILLGEHPQVRPPLAPPSVSDRPLEEPGPKPVAPPVTPVAPVQEAEKETSTSDPQHRAFGQIIYDDYKASAAQYPGCIFAISVTEDGRVDFFAHRSQDRWWNINHEDLSPMHFESTVRGRLEEDEQKHLLMTLKEPQSTREYFEFKGVPEAARTEERHIIMVHDEYIRIARKLIETGLPVDTNVELAGAAKYFPAHGPLVTDPAFPLLRLAQEPLTDERESLGEHA